MKAYLLFDNGEKRTRLGDLVWETIRAKGKPIEIPDWPTTLYYGFQTEHQVQDIKEYIPLPHPKKMVKKWRWVYEDPYDPNGFDYTESYFTESGVRAWAPNRKWYHNIEGTEIEVEE